MRDVGVGITSNECLEEAGCGREGYKAEGEQRQVGQAVTSQEKLREAGSMRGLQGADG